MAEVELVARAKKPKKLGNGIGTRMNAGFEGARKYRSSMQKVHIAGALAYTQGETEAAGAKQTCRSSEKAQAIREVNKERA